uniref:THAP domain-containing protein 1 n=1 Tax=Fundulus heteroclitus TaxID=8078 RepID=A0A3Q2QJI4_FUNHE
VTRSDPCDAIHCSNLPGNISRVSFFSFPKDEELCQIWISKLRRENYSPNSGDRLCSDHFEEDCLKCRPSLMKSILHSQPLFNYKRLTNEDEDVPTTNMNIVQLRSRVYASSRYKQSY